MMWPTLKSQSHFDEVYSRGRRQVCAALVLIHLESAPDTRVAFVASRKIGGAVQRNRAKRLMREAFRQVETSASMPPGWLVMIARRDILRLKSVEVAERLRGLLAAGRAVGNASQVRPLA